jgi:hypothetical protein
MVDAAFYGFLIIGGREKRLQMARFSRMAKHIEAMRSGFASN